MDRRVWETAVAAELGGRRALAELQTSTPEGLPKRPLYGPQDLPGDLPPAAGVAGWIRVTAPGTADPEAARAELAADLACGAQGIEIALTRPSALRGLDPTLVVLAPGGDPAATLEAAAAALPDATLVGGADPLAALARDGGLPPPVSELAQAEASLVSAVRRSEERGGARRPLLVDCGVYHAAGAHGVQELAFGLSTAVHYLRLLDGQGLEAGRAAQRLGFAFDVGRDLFGEVAKLRAARLLWDRVLRALDLEPQPVWIHARTARRTLTRRDPWTNALRATTQVLAAVVGGADSVLCIPYDAALGRPSELARSLARSTHNILAEEGGLDRVADPARGSYYVECRTLELARAAWQRFRRLEADGGLAAGLLDGSLRAELDATWEARGDLPVLGVDVFPLEGEVPLKREPEADVPPDIERIIDPFPRRREAEALEVGWA